MFENVPRLEILLRMAEICQMSADETETGDDQARMQHAADKFRNEAFGVEISALRHDMAARSA